MSALLLVKNRRAFHDYELLEKYTAGIQLEGYEVKAIRERKADLSASYVQILNGELFVVNMHVGRYSQQSQPYDEQRARRNRLLLVTAGEREKIAKELDQKGITAVPLALVLQNNFIKLEFALARGRKEFEKKIVAKERQIKRDLEADTKDVRRGLSL